MNKLSLTERVEKLENKEWYDKDNHFILIDHFWGLVFLSIVLVLATLFFSHYLYQPLDNNIVPIKYYYEDSNSFCRHFNMTYDSPFLSLAKCIEFRNDTAIYHYIEQVNNRWVFTEDE